MAVDKIIYFYRLIIAHCIYSQHVISAYIITKTQQILCIPPAYVLHLKLHQPKIKNWVFKDDRYTFRVPLQWEHLKQDLW